MIGEIGLDERRVFITSPVHYLPLRGTPSAKTVLHGREHLLKQLSVIDPEIVVLLGNTACLALFGSKASLTREHGRVVRKDGRTYLITYHPAYAMRFPEGKKQFASDFAKLKALLQNA
jgi:DNA polymerase